MRAERRGKRKMAYLAHIEAPDDEGSAPAHAELGTERADFTPLEWSIIRLAREHSLSTIREPGRLSRIFNWIIGRRGNPSLASERLEALRRMAIVSRHFGFSIPGEDVADFLSSGFTPEQYELLVTSVRAAARPRPQVTSREVYA
jgi:hypothetical protein